MSDPQALPDKPKTRRAPPLQPDRPGGGDTPPPPDAGQAPAPGAADPQQSAQALENVREGYGKRSG